MKYSLAILTAFAVLPNAAFSGDADRADPADPEAQVPAYKYESAFRGYRRDPDVAVADWRATGFDPSAPRMDAMGHMGMQHAPAPAPLSAQPPSVGDAASTPGMHHMYKM